MMLLKNVNDIELLNDAVNHCRDDVMLYSSDGTEEYNLKSEFSRFVALSELCKDDGKDYELFCMNRADESYMLKFFQELEERHGETMALAM